MYRPLAPCPGCSRHVRVDDGACPFCGAAFAAALAPRPGVDARRRLSRAALFTFAASVGGAGCSSAVTTTDAAATPDTAAVVDAPVAVDRPAATDQGVATDTGAEDTGSIGVRYGAPPVDAGPPDDDGGPFPEYGSPPPVDAGAPDDEGNVNADYGSPPLRDGGIFPLYGAPPRPDAGD